jgi:hypothetical protein
MKFLYPAFLFALFSILIPILIHLFSFRRFKTIYFSHVGFLKDIKKESQKKSRLKHLLILFARILTLIFLVFAFSQPYIPFDQEMSKQPHQAVAIYIDNSFSMNALSESGQLLEAARKKALEICMAYPAGTKFYILTNDLEPKHLHFFNREQMIRQISEIQISPASVPLSLIYNRLTSLFYGSDQKTDKFIYLISDFQRNSTDIANFNDQSVLSYFMPLRSNQTSNLFIDSCWVEVPEHRLNQEETLYVRIRNNSENSFENLPVTFSINDSVKSITSFSVEAQNEMVTELKFINTSGGIKKGKVEITDYPFTHDNQWFMGYEVKPSIKALVLGTGTKESDEGISYISSLFKDDDYVKLDIMDMKNLQISRLSEYNTIFILNAADLSTGFQNEIRKNVANGVSVVLFPLLRKDFSELNKFTEQFEISRITAIDTSSMEISGVDFENPFFNNVFIKKEDNAVTSSIKGHYKFETTRQIAETKLLWFRNSDKALSYSNFEKGKVWMFGFPLISANESFIRDILFVPTLYNIVLNSLPSQKNAYTVGRDQFIEIQNNQRNGSFTNLEVVDEKSGERFIPDNIISPAGLRIGLGSNIRESGYYRIELDKKQIALLAFNYDRKESDLSFYSAGELSDIAQKSNLRFARVIENNNREFREIFSEIQNGQQLWKYCIMLALFFLMAEVIITRFWK